MYISSYLIKQLTERHFSGVKIQKKKKTNNHLFIRKFVVVSDEKLPFMQCIVRHCSIIITHLNPNAYILKNIDMWDALTQTKSNRSVLRI
jgi:hypothetical protein